MKPDITVIMPIYKESLKQIKEAVRSIIQQTYKNFTFIVVIDNPSNIEGKRYIQEHQKKTNNIKIIENQSNIGLAKSLNKAVFHVKTEYVARMDADDIAHPDRLLKQKNYMSKHMEIDFLFSQAYIIDEDSKVIGNITPTSQTFANIKKNIFIKNEIIHPSLMVKSEVIKKLLYNENSDQKSKKFVQEDFELRLRAIPNYKFDIVEEKLLYYRVPFETSIEKRIKKQKTYNIGAINSLKLHVSTYRKNRYYRAFRIKSVLIYIICKLPEKVIRKIIDKKDYLQSIQELGKNKGA